MDSVTEENIDKIIKERNTKVADLATLKATDEKQLWLNELAILRSEYVKMMARINTSTIQKPPAKIKISKVKSKV